MNYESLMNSYHFAVWPAELVVIHHAQKGFQNLGQNIWGLCHVLTQFSFTTSEMKLDYHHQKVYMWFGEQVAEQGTT